MGGPGHVGVPLVATEPRTSLEVRFAANLFAVLRTVGCDNSWKQKIFSELKSHTPFPPEACGHAGEPELAFALDRSGKVIFSKRLSGSGVAAIDTAAVAAVNSAQPFPPAPPDALDNDLRFVIGLAFAKPEGVSTEEFSRRCEGLRDEIKLRSRLRGVCRGC
jgi:protein TonB